MIINSNEIEIGSPKNEKTSSHSPTNSFRTPTSNESTTKSSSAIPREIPSFLFQNISIVLDFFWWLSPDLLKKREKYILNYIPKTEREK